MYACGQVTVGSVLQQSKQPNCIQAEQYLLTAVCLCANYVDNMSLSLMEWSKLATLGTAPMKKVRIVLNAYLELVTQFLMVLRNMIYQSALQGCPHLRSDLKLV